jgi:hypothetical protein
VKLGCLPVPVELRPPIWTWVVTTWQSDQALMTATCLARCCTGISMQEDNGKDGTSLQDTSSTGSLCHPAACGCSMYHVFTRSQLLCPAGLLEDPTPRTGSLLHCSIEFLQAFHVCRGIQCGSLAVPYGVTTLTLLDLHHIPYVDKYDRMDYMKPSAI